MTFITSGRLETINFRVVANIEGVSNASMVKAFQTVSSLTGKAQIDGQ
ncbi:MAG: hypothetical protein WB422_11805 [Pseudolabrys sp.]